MLQERAKEFETRKSDITEAIGEATTEEEIDALNEGMDQLETEWKEHEETESRLSGEIAALEQQLTEEEQRGTPPINNPESGANTERSNHMTTTINIRSLPFGQRVMDALPRQERDAIIGQEDSKNFLAQLRSLKGEKRGVSGGELTIPVVFLDLIAENMYRYSKTYATLKSKAITFTASGDVVANVYGILPIVTGDIDILEFIPDGDIIGGYGDLYLYADRARMTIEESREVQFLQDNTVFKGKARADGTPVVPGAFVAININGSEVTTAMPFAADTANDADLDSLSVGTGSLSPTFDAATQSYTLSTTAASLAVNAAAAQIDAKVAISYGRKNVANGGNITPTAGASTLTVTVTNGNATKVYTVAITKT